METILDRMESNNNYLEWEQLSLVFLHALDWETRQPPEKWLLLSELDLDGHSYPPVLSEMMQSLDALSTLNEKRGLIHFCEWVKVLSRVVKHPSFLKEIVLMIKANDQDRLYWTLSLMDCPFTLKIIDVLLVSLVTCPAPKKSWLNQEPSLRKLALCLVGCKPAAKNLGLYHDLISLYLYHTREQRVTMADTEWQGFLTASLEWKEKGCSKEMMHLPIWDMLDIGGLF